MVAFLIYVWLWLAPVWFVAFGSAAHRGLVKRRYWIPCSLFSVVSIAVACHMIIRLCPDREELIPVFFIMLVVFIAAVIQKIVHRVARRKS